MYEIQEYNESGDLVGTYSFADSDEPPCPADEDTGARTPPDNTDAWGPFFRTRLPRWTIAVRWVREIEPPYRRGWGVALGRRILGIWFQGAPPEAIPEDINFYSNISTVELADAGPDGDRNLGAKTHPSV